MIAKDSPASSLFPLPTANSGQVRNGCLSLSSLVSRLPVKGEVFQNNGHFGIRTLSNSIRIADSDEWLMFTSLSIFYFSVKYIKEIIMRIAEMIEIEFFSDLWPPELYDRTRWECVPRHRSRLQNRPHRL